MSRRDNALVRCRRCHLHDSLCVCALLPRLETRTRLYLLIHLFEARKPSNTGLLAAECLPNHRVVLRDHESDAAAGAQPLDLTADAERSIEREHLPLARARGILAGARGPAVRAALEEAFLLMVERTLWSRGLLSTEELTRPIPAGIQRHDPRRPHTVAEHRRAKVQP